VRIGIQLANEHTTMPALRRAWTHVDQLDVDTLWVWDHMLPIHHDPGGAHFECWSLLAAMAATTRRVELGPLVTCPAFRNPALLAAMAGTVDQLAGGRLILGFGAGWFRPDFDELGLEFGRARNRVEALERTIVAVRERWERAAHQQARRIPVLIGTGGERFGLRVAARHADIWNWFGPVDEFAAKSRALDEWCERVGRSPAEITRSVTLYDVGELDALDEYAEAGARHVILGVHDPWDWDAVDRLARWAAGVRARETANASA
jgi:probable F420-dependent oxidoreductase